MFLRPLSVCLCALFVCVLAISAFALPLSSPITQLNQFIDGSNDLVSSTLVISQIYGGAGCGTANCSTYSSDYVEIYNRGTTTVNVNGWSVQYAATTGTTWTAIALPNVNVLPGRFLLVAGQFSANGTTAIPTADATGSTVNMSATAGKVALLNSTTASSGNCPTAANTIDLVGYGTGTNCFEGAAPATAPSTTRAIFRFSTGGDTDQNANDFASATPSPRNSASPGTFDSHTNDYFRSKASGNWSDTATWESSTDNATWVAATLTPTSAAKTITIQAGHSVDVDTAVTVDQVVVAAGGTLIAENGTLTVNDATGDDLSVSGALKVNGALTNNGQIRIANTMEVKTGFPSFSGTGTIAYDTNALLFYSGSSTLTAANTTSTAMFWPTVNGPQNFVIAPGSGGADIQVPRTLNGTLTTYAGLYSAQNFTINGTLQLAYGAQVNGNPIYGPNSLLVYVFSGHQANRGGEWASNVTSGPGFPHDVLVSDSTLFNAAFGAGSDFVQMGGKLTIDNGATVETNGMYNSFIVGGDVQLDGYLGLAASGGDMRVHGNWHRSATGVLAARSRNVSFDSTGDQTIFDDNTWDFLIFPDTGAARTIKFEAGKTQSTNGYAGFTVQGSAGKLISLRSTVDGTQWNLWAGNGHIVNYADVKDSFAQQYTINPTNSVNSGNNTNWNFPVPATVAFSSSVYNVAEGTSQAALTITRGGSSSTAFSVDLYTLNGTATSGFCGNAGADYQSIQTTVSFESGDTSKVVNIPVCTDDLTESPAETFTVTLANPTNGITLGPVNPATVKIIDAATEFTNAMQLDAGPNQVVSSDVMVSGYQGNVSGMRVTLFGVTATVADDMDMLLVDPFGHKYALVGDVGGSNSLNNATLTFDDNGSAGFLPDSTAIAEGQNYKPTNCESPFTDFSGLGGTVTEPGCGPTLTNTLAGTFGGEKPNGAWTLYVRNDAGNALGVSNVSISGWGIQFISPTAAPVSLSGRVITSEGETVRGASVTISGGDLAAANSVRTDALGRYAFTGLHPGVTYVVSARAKGSVIANAVRPVTLLDDVAGIDFIAQPRR